MSISDPSQRVWTVAEAKAKLSEVLRLAETEGPQRIGTRKPFVVVPEHVWAETQGPPKEHLGRWMLDNLRGLCDDLPLPSRHSSRPIPFDEFMDEREDEEA